MSRLDHHVGAVRTRIALSLFLRAAAWTLMGYGVIVLLAMVIHRFTPLAIPLARPWLWGGVGAAVALAVALGYTIRRWPSRHEAAVAIDRSMGLNEKFSTALFARSSTDPFAMAAVRDAETTADRIRLQHTAPIRAPWMLAAVPGLMVLMVALVLVFGSRPVVVVGYQTGNTGNSGPKAAQDARKLLEQAMDKIADMPDTAAKDPQVQEAAREIKGLMQKPIRDPEKVRQTAQDRMNQMENIKQKIKETAAVAKAQNEMKVFKSMPMPSDSNTPIGKVQTEIAKGNFSNAVEDLKDVVDKFPDMKQEEKEKTAKDMSNMAKQMQQIAKDTKKQDEIKDQLQKMGASKSQLDKLQQAVQGAAKGDPQAQQQVQQLANQIAQDINQNGGMTQQQQQQIADTVKQQASKMQNAANNQAAAQQMAGAASAMAQAMQQAAAQGNKGNNGQGNKGQAGGPQQTAGAGNKSGQQQQQNGPGTPDQQPKPGTPTAGTGTNQEDAAAQMKEQLQQMQRAADDAAAIAQGRMANGEPDGAAPDGAGQDGNGQQGQMAGQGGMGEFRQGEIQGKGNGAGGPGIAAAGGRPKPQEAAFGVKQEVSPSHTNEKGKLLASSFIKSLSDKGKSKVGLAEAIESEEKDATDEVEQDRISRQAQGAVKRYFDQVKQGEGEEGTPTTQPAKAPK